MELVETAVLGTMAPQNRRERFEPTNHLKESSPYALDVAVPALGRKSMHDHVSN